MVALHSNARSLRRNYPGQVRWVGEMSPLSLKAPQRINSGLQKFASVFNDQYLPAKTPFQETAQGRKRLGKIPAGQRSCLVQGADLLLQQGQVRSSKAITKNTPLPHAGSTTRRRPRRS